MLAKFTDDDLKRLKEEFEPYVPGDPRILTGSDWEGLIARMEASEHVCKLLDDHEFNSCPRVSEGLRAWRKAAGK